MHGSRPCWSPSPHSCGHRALGAGDTTAFTVICVLSGIALGADLALPPSLLADVIGRRGRMEATGSYFGLWTLATKLNLALAAGIALPLYPLWAMLPVDATRRHSTALAIVYAFRSLRAQACRVRALIWFKRSQ